MRPVAKHGYRDQRPPARVVQAPQVGVERDLDADRALAAGGPRAAARPTRVPRTSIGSVAAAPAARRSVP